jgi:hypothetical protein
LHPNSEDGYYSQEVYEVGDYYSMLKSSRMVPWGLEEDAALMEQRMLGAA